MASSAFFRKKLLAASLIVSLCPFTLTSGVHALEIGNSDDMPGLRQAAPQDSENNLENAISAASIPISEDIPNSAEAQTALFLLGNRENTSLNLETALPQNFYQTVEKWTPEGAYLRTWKKAPSDILMNYPVNDDRNFLAETELLDLKDAGIFEQAKSLTQGEKRAWVAAGKLQQWISKNIATNRLTLDLHPASATLVRKEGDAADKAILLAALCRSIGIPARLAMGVEYHPNRFIESYQFSFHVWTEIHTSDWVALDGTHPSTPADATHITLMTDDGESRDTVLEKAQETMSLIPKLKLTVLEVNAPGTSIISLSGRSDETLLEIPRFNLDAVDISKLTQENIKHFAITQPRDPVLQNSVEGQFTLGVEKLYDGDFETARMYFEKASKKATFPLEHYHLGERLAGLALFSLADAEFQKAAALDPSLETWRLIWHREIFPKTLPDTAVEKTWARALSLESGKSAAGGKLLAKQAVDSSESALQSYQNLLESAPDFYPALVHIARLSDNPSDTFHRLLGLRGNDPRILDKQGDWLLHQGNTAQALVEFRKAQALCKQFKLPEFQVLETNLDAKIHLAQGNQLTRRDEKDPTGWLEMARGLYQQKDLKNALQAVTNALILSPGNTAAKLLKLEILLDTSEWQDAQKTMETISEAETSGNRYSAGQYHFLKGYFRMRLRNYPDALTLLSKAKTEIPEEADVYHALADLYLRLDNPEQAQKTLREGLSKIKQGDEQTYLRYRLGEMLLESAPDETANLARQLLGNSPADVTALTLLGKAYLATSRPLDAKRVLEEARALNPYSVSTLKALGDLAVQSGGAEKALEYYQHALKISPENSDVADAMFRVAQKHNLKTRLPKQYFPLTDDEKDYLIRTFELSSQNMATYKNFYDEIIRVTPHYGEINVEALEEQKNTIPVMNRYFDLFLKAHEEIKQIAPPERFRQYHQALKMLSYMDLKGMNLLLTELPFLHTSHSIQELQEKIISYNQSYMQQQQQLTGALNRLQESVGKATIQELAASSSLSPQATNDMISSQIAFSKHLAVRAEKKSATENAKDENEKPQSPDNLLPPQ